LVFVILVKHGVFLLLVRLEIGATRSLQVVRGSGARVLLQQRVVQGAPETRPELHFLRLVGELNSLLHVLVILGEPEPGVGPDKVAYHFTPETGFLAVKVLIVELDPLVLFLNLGMTIHVVRDLFLPTFHTITHGIRLIHDPIFNPILIKLGKQLVQHVFGLAPVSREDNLRVRILNQSFQPTEKRRFQQLVILPGLELV